MTKKLSNYFNLIVFSVPLLLITGPFLPDLFIVLAVIFGIFAIFIQKLEFSSIDNKILKIFMIMLLFFGIYVFICSIFLFFQIEKLETTIFYFRFIFFALLSSLLFELKDLKFIRLFLFLYLIVFSLFFFDALSEYFIGKNFLSFLGLIDHPGKGILRVSSFFHEEKKMGRYIIFFYPITIYFILKLYKDSNILSILLIPLSLISFFLVLFSGERTAFLLFFIFLFFSLFFCSKKIKKIFIAKLLLISFIGFFCYFKFNNLNERIVNQTIEQIDFSSTESIYKLGFLGNVYQGHFMSSVYIFKDNIFFGAGPKSFRYLCKEFKYEFNSFSCSTHSHNITLQFLSEIGLFGFAFLICFYIFLISILFGNFIFKRYQIADDIKIISIALLTFLLPLAPSLNFFNNWNSAIIFILIVLLMYELKKIRLKR